VPVARLDELLDPAELAGPCLMKIDVQGFEAEVLRGAAGLLPAVDDVLVECSFVELYEGQPLADDLIAWMRDEGYRLRGFYSLMTDDAGSCLQADLLFSRPQAGETAGERAEDTSSASQRS
jgi:hypothetical protein